ncbi:myb-related protein 306-like [Phalaenopsis equestris]|uniref:myb-related protein 306-like n=1 Tax=Phalaenopsis equestris TaxID=78828 RepID=UPI0009E51A2F|nr:myb-related protein 306-like [Phalaenopsis equestris]
MRLSAIGYEGLKGRYETYSPVIIKRGKAAHKPHERFSFDPLHATPNALRGKAISLKTNERDRKTNETGFPLEQQQQQPFLPGLGLEGLSGGSGSNGSEKNGHSEEHEGEHESGQSKLCVRGHWRPAEDAKLRELVAQYGPQNWNLIAENLEGRSGKSCRLRWFNQLDPRINKKAFTEEEEEKLLSAHRLYGNKWALIARFFPGRTDNAVKNHWHVIVARRHREQTNAHRRRKSSNTISSSSVQEFSNNLQVNCYNNACIVESSISGNIDESLPTCTELSLNSSAYGSFRGHAFFPTHTHQTQPQQFQYFTGSGEKDLTGENGGSQRQFDSPLALAPATDHSGYSDSNYEISATGSVVKQGNAFILEEGDDNKEKISSSFIDFFGVGAT